MRSDWLAVSLEENQVVHIKCAGYRSPVQPLVPPDINVMQSDTNTAARQLILCWVIIPPALSVVGWPLTVWFWGRTPKLHPIPPTPRAMQLALPILLGKRNIHWQEGNIALGFLAISAYLMAIPYCDEACAACDRFIHGICNSTGPAQPFHRLQYIMPATASLVGAYEQNEFLLREQAFHM